MSWNYRIGRELNPQATHCPGDCYLYSIIEVYYDEGKATGYAKVNPTANWTSDEELSETINLLKLAVTKPTLDLNHWPNEIT